MDFGYLAPFGAVIVAGVLILLFLIAHRAEQAVHELRSIKQVLLNSLYDEDGSYSEVRNIAGMLRRSKS